MSLSAECLTDVGKSIQLALAPVFLLTGIAGLLNVMAGRLARIIDRGRKLTEEPANTAVLPEIVLRELNALERRRHWTSIAITSCTIAALLVCLIISSLFIETMLGISLKWVVGTLFTLTTFALIFGLSFFLREVHIATQTVRIPLVRE